MVQTGKLDQVIREHLKSQDISSLDMIKHLYTTLGALINFTKVDANDFLTEYLGQEANKDELLKKQIYCGIGLILHIQEKFEGEYGVPPT